MFLPPPYELAPSESPARQYEYRGREHSRADELLLPELWRMLRMRGRAIVACVVAGLVLALLYILVKSPRYEASAQIEVSPAGTNSLGLDELATRVLSPADPTLQLQSAVAVLQSKTVALSAMQQTKLAERSDFAGRWVQPPDTDVTTLTPEARDQLLLRFQKNLKVEIVPKTDIIQVQFRAKDPQLAAQVVNATVSSYTERNFRSSYDAATQVSRWLSAQMDDLKSKTNEAQEKLAALQKQRGLIGVDETDNIVTDKLKDLNEQLTTAESDRIVKEARYRIAGSGNPELIASTVPDPTLQVLRSQQAQLRVDYAKLSTKYGEGYPRLAELGNEIAQVDSAISQELKNLSDRYKNEYLAAANTEKMLQAKFEEQKQKAYDLNQGAAQYAILKHEVEATQDLYQTLQLKLKQAGIVAGLASANIGLVESGQIPSEPVDPRPLLDLLLGLGGGLGLGLVSALTLEALDTTVRSVDETEAICALPALAEIPQVAIQNRGMKSGNIWATNSLAAAQLIAQQRPHSRAAESYRCLRTSLLLRSGTVAPKVLAVTSAISGEGKTLTAINCAIVLAQQGAKVLLVDADLRQPTIHDAFALPLEPGLSAVLEGNNPSDEAAYASVLQNLSVLPAGSAPEYPAELLVSSKFDSVLEYWRSRYEYVVLDTPPVSIFSDAVALGCRVDTVLLVARYRATTRYALRHACDTLHRANVNVAGVVFNGVDQRYESSYYHPFGYGFAHKPAAVNDSKSSD